MKIPEVTRKMTYLLIFATIIICFGFLNQSKNEGINDDEVINYIVNPKEQDLSFFWKNENGENFKNAENLILWLKTKNKKLLFSTNGGMYKKDNSPQGLYIENSIKKVEIDTANGSGNFYLKPNGIFFITTDKKPIICETAKFVDNGKIKFATQSGPMLILNGKIHSEFKQKSTNLNIRNGVGILPNNHIIFAMSKKEINFYEFAEYFKKMGCKNALYLDGFVSRAYLPKKNWKQLDGNFGVIIGVVK